MTAQPDLFGETRSSAVVSECGTYRYRLIRRWAPGDTLAWVMLNPSIADAEMDDPTIRRCRGFAQQWGYGSIVVVNLFALRATDPRELQSHADPIGPENDAHLGATALHIPAVICAWGANKAATTRAQAVSELLASRNLGPLLCLGTTKDGAPRHPLYVPAVVEPVPFGSNR